MGLAYLDCSFFRTYQKNINSHAVSEAINEFKPECLAKFNVLKIEIRVEKIAGVS